MSQSLLSTARVYISTLILYSILFYSFDTAMNIESLSLIYSIPSPMQTLWWFKFLCLLLRPFSFSFHKFNFKKPPTPFRHCYWRAHTFTFLLLAMHLSLAYLFVTPYLISIPLISYCNCITPPQAPLAPSPIRPHAVSTTLYLPLSLALLLPQTYSKSTNPRISFAIFC